MRSLPKKHKQKTDLKKPLAAVLVVAAACVGMLYYDFSQYFTASFLQGTRINGVSVGGMTEEEVNEKLGDRYGLKVKFRGGTTEVLRGQDVDYEVTSSGAVKEALGKQSFLDYMGSMFAGKSIKTSLKGSYSEEKLKQVAESWPELQEKNMEKPRNAFVQYKKGTFQVAPEVEGTTLDTKKTMEALGEAISQDREVLDLTKEDQVYEAPERRADDKKLNRDVKTLNKMKWASVTYKLPSGKTMTLDGNTTKDWLSRDDDGNLYKDSYKWEEKVSEFVNEMADKADTVYKKHPFKTHSGKVIKLKGTGYYGWMVARETEIVELENDLESGKEITREPMYLQEEKTTRDNNYGFGDTYIEIDLSAQHLWFYKKGKVVLESDVVSGNAGIHPTPEGAYQLLDKARNVVLRGPAKTEKVKDKKGKVVETKTTYEWESPVSYWMPINYEGVGMHDASWRGAFGGDIWRYNGSHGCINLPVSFAPQLFEKVKVKTPVAVYY